MNLGIILFLIVRSENIGQYLSKSTFINKYSAYTFKALIINNFYRGKLLC